MTTTFEQMKAAVDAATLGAWSVHTDRRGLETILCDDPNDGDCCWEIAKMPPGEANAAAIVAALNWLRGGGIAQVEAMREALRPFARFLDCLEVMGSNTPKSGVWYALESSVVGEREITIEDFAAARAALAATEEAK